MMRGFGNGTALVLAAIVTLGSVVPAQAYDPGTYETAFTGKRGSAYNEDINIWVYTSDFARRFGMPEKWVDDDLKGAYAVAFRVEEAPIRTMFPHKGPEVGKRQRGCMLDVFLDNSIELPWVDERQVGISYRYSAPRYLVPQSEEDQEWDHAPVGFPTYNGPVMLESRIGDSGTLSTIQFNKLLYPDISFVSFEMGCTTPPNVKSWIEFRESEQAERLFHKVEIPEGFMKRLYGMWDIAARGPNARSYSKILKMR